MPISIEADPTLAQGYLKVNGTTAATVTSTGLTTASLQNAAVTTTKVNDAAITAPKLSGGQAGSAPIYGCRAWVNFDGTKDSTGAVSTANTNRLIRASGNVASVLRNGAGDYTITFNTAMPDADYAATLFVWHTDNGGVSAGSAGAARGPCGGHIKGTTVPTASTVTIQTLYGSSAAADGAIGEFSGVYVTIFR